MNLQEGKKLSCLCDVLVTRVEFQNVVFSVYCRLPFGKTIVLNKMQKQIVTFSNQVVQCAPATRTVIRAMALGHWSNMLKNPQKTIKYLPIKI